MRHRKKTAEIGIDERGSGPDQQKAGAKAEHLLHHRVNGVVEAGERNENADGKHGARHRIPDRSDAAAHVQQLRLVQPCCIDKRDGKAGDEAGGDERHHHAVAHRQQECRILCLLEAAERLPGQHAGRDDEAEHHGKGADTDGQQRPQAGELVPRRGVVLAPAAVEAQVPPGAALKRQQNHDDDQHGAG